MAYRCSWYEDDCVQYTDGGRLPKVPERYRRCWLKTAPNGCARKYKSFITKGCAEVALKWVLRREPRDYRYERHLYDGFEIIHCRKCGMWHIMGHESKETLDDNDMKC